MRLSSLTLHTFRNYGTLTLRFPEENILLLVGNNGAGKTNILEAISILSCMKSCLGSEESDMMNWGEQFYRVQGDIVSDGGDTQTMEVASQLHPRKQKACFVNDVKKPLSELVGILPTVTFLPRDLELFLGAPAYRRNFLDQLLCQVSPEYVQVLLTYQKIIKQRNSLLRKIHDGVAETGDLLIWNEKVAEMGTIVTLRRLELIEVLQCALPEELSSLSEQWCDPQIVYVRKGVERTFDALKDEFLDLLSHFQERDIILQSTTVGPHRDDWHLAVDDRPLVSFASRGQQRTAMLALLFLQVSYLELKRGEKPVILLDDVFSELDDTHQASLLHSLQEHQVIITSTHIPKTVGDAVVWEVEEGVVRTPDCVLK